MTRTMTRFSRCTLLLAFLAVAVTMGLTISATEHIGPLHLAVVLMLFIVGPYGALATFAWLTRSYRIASIILFFLTLALAAGGLSLFSYDCYQFHTDPEHRLAQRMVAFIVPLGQWFVIGWIGLALLPLLLGKATSRSQLDQSQPEQSQPEQS